MEHFSKYFIFILELHVVLLEDLLLLLQKQDDKFILKNHSNATVNSSVSQDAKVGFSPIYARK